MFEFLLYLLKVSGCLLAFYVFYVFIIRKHTFFFINRLYLLSGLLLSFIIPILKLSIFNAQSDLLLSGLIKPIINGQESEYFQIQNIPTHVNSINLSLLISVIYFTGISILFFKLLFSIHKIIRIKNNSEIRQLSKYRIVKMDIAFPFSFFNLIFLPKNEPNPMIIEHEMAHIRQFHWFDLILIEVTAVLLWFNPFVVLYKRALKLQHEYLADYKVVMDNNHIESYLHCMLRQVQVVSTNGLISQFYCKTIKKRIIMITKNKTSVKYLGLYLLVLPLICLLLFAFTSNRSHTGFISKYNSVVTGSGVVPSIYPVDAKKIKNTNGYGERVNPISREKDFHYGIDFAAAEGEKIMVTANGTVIEAKFDQEKKKGNYILVQHNEIYSTFYSHLQSISVKAGDKLEMGQVIGYVGNTGIGTGPHLHYEVIKNGERVNPADYLPK